MGNVIRVDFRQEKGQRDMAFRRFEEAMARHEKQQKFKFAFAMVLLSFMVIGAMAVPFVLNYFSSYFVK